MSTENARLTVVARWRPHTEIPLQPTSALIAIPMSPDEGVFLLPRLYEFNPVQKRWEDQISAAPLSYSVFFWIDEEDLAPDDLFTQL